MTKYLIMWFPMLLIAIVNGAVRESWFKKEMSALTAHQFSTITLIFLFACYMAVVFWKYRPASGYQALQIGILWMIMTLTFEFGFGKWRGNSWHEMLQDYNILKGRLWVLVPAWICIAPYLFYKFFSK
jgi:hypothetical protein